MTTIDAQPTLAAALWPVATQRRLLRGLVLVVVGTLLLTLSAKIKVPFYPVPLTFQTLVVLALGMAYGWRLAASTLAVYLLTGALGLPVFAGTPEKGIGLAYVMGPTGGYLLGFIMAATLCGWLAERGWDRRVASSVLALLLGNVLIYLPGLLWLGAVVGWDKPVLQWGLYPFVVGDLLKLGLAAAALPFAWRLLRRV